MPDSFEVDLKEATIPTTAKSEFSKRTLGFIIGIVVTIVLLAGGIWFMVWIAKEPVMTSTSTRNSISPPGTHRHPVKLGDSGTFELSSSSTDWYGVTCTDPRAEIYSKIRAEGVYFQIRFDGDDNRTYTIYTGRRDELNHFNLPDGGNVKEWRLKPGQNVKNVTLLFEIRPKRDLTLEN